MKKKNWSCGFLGLNTLIQRVAALLAVSTLLVLGISTPVMAKCNNNTVCEKGENAKNCADCSENGGTGGGSALPLIVRIDGLEFDNVLHDGDEFYVDGEKVHAVANPEGRLVVSTQSRGKRGREMIVKGVCESVQFGRPGDDGDFNLCHELLEVSPTWDVKPDGSLLGSIGRLSVNPYVENCPGPTCPDVFTMGTGDAQLMGFRLLDGSSSNMEAASGVSGAFFEPGRCLPLLTRDQSDAFLAHNCPTPSHCNVTVEAFDTDSPPDGVNDKWRIDTLDEFGDPIEVTALICTSGRVLGQIKLMLGVDFEVKP